MTTREKVERLLDRLSETELAAEYERLRAAVEVEPGDEIDDWGNLSAFVRASSSSVFRRLDEEEAKIGFSWEQQG